MAFKASKKKALLYKMNMVVGSKKSFGLMRPRWRCFFIMHSTMFGGGGGVVN